MRARSASNLRRSHRLAALALGLALGMATSLATQAATLTGSAFTADLDVLPRQATFEAQLVQLNSRDEVAKVLSSARVERPAPGIVSFELDYEPADLDAGQRYAVSARIQLNGKLLFVSDQRIPVVLPAEGGSPATVVLRMVRAPAPAAAPSPAPAPAASSPSSAAPAPQAGLEASSPLLLSPDDL